MIVGIERLWFCVRDIALIQFKKTLSTGQSWSLAVYSFINRWILLSFGYVGHIEEIFIFNGGDWD
jgi:hypothetical protein